MCTVSDPDPDWIRIQSGQWIASGFGIRIQGGQKLPTKMGNIKKFHVLNCWLFSLRAEGFFCSLDVLYEGLGIGKLKFLIKKI
jgi:hypothetical protein